MAARTISQEVDVLWKQIGNPTETIRQLILQNDQIKLKHREDVHSFRQQIDHLQNDLSSLHAENVSDLLTKQRLKNQLDRSRQTHEQFNRRSAEELRQLKILLKSREKDNYNKDVALASQDRIVRELTERETGFQKESVEYKSTIEKLKQAFKEQQLEISEQQTFISSLLHYIEQFQAEHDLFVSHRSLYEEYRQELQQQISQVEAVNERLLQKTANYGELQQELACQNSQSNDLINLSENMLETMEAQ